MRLCGGISGVPGPCLGLLGSGGVDRKAKLEGTERLNVLFGDTPPAVGYQQHI